MTIQHSTMNNSDKAFANYTNTNLNDSHLVKYNNGYDNYYYTNVNKNLKKSFLPVSQSKLANYTTSNNLNIIKPNTKVNNAQLNKNNHKQDNDTDEYYSVPYNYFNPTNKNINVNDLHKTKHPLPSLQQKNSISSNQQQPQQPQQAKLSRKNLNESPPHQSLLNNENAKAHQQQQQQQSQIKNSTPDPVKSKNSLPNSLIGKAIVRNMNDSKLSKKEANGLNSNKTKSETNLASTEPKLDKKASEQLAVSNSISSNNSNLISNNGKILVKKKKKAKMSSDEEIKHEQRLKRSVSMINGLDTNNANITSNHKLKPSRHELSSRSSSSSSLLSTCSSIVNSIEDTDNLYELTIKIKKYLNKIEKNFSLESLYDYLKSNVKYNGYRNFTLDSLEPYLLASNRTSNMGLYETNGSQLQTKHNNGNNQPYRSLSQLRKSNNNTPYLTQQSQNSNYDLNGRPNNKRPVESLFKNMNVFKNLLVMIQRNLLDELVDLPPMQNEAAYKSPLTPIKSIALSPRSAERQEKHANFNKMNRPGSKSLINLNQIDSKYSNHKQPFVSQITKSISSLNYDNGHAKLKQSLKKYNRKLYDLNEKLTVLINDQTSCDLKLLSFNSNLPIKYEYYKHGEYILRLTTDIIFKMRLVLKLSEKAYQLNYKLNARENSNASRLSFYESDKIEEGEGSESDIVSSSDGSNRDSILRKISRKKTNSRMQLPKINHRVNSKTANLNKDIRINNNLSDDIDIGPFAYGDNYQAAKQQQNKIKEAQTNKLKEDFESINNLAKSEDNKRKKLVKQDTNDSFIQDTDCSSILSEDSNAYFSNEINEITNKEKKDNSDYIKVNVAENPKPSKNEANANPKAYSKMQKVEDRNSLFEAYQSVRAQMESTNQNIRELNVYLQTLIQRAERCAKLEDLLHSDQDLIRKTENSLKVYGSDKLNKNGMDPNSKMNDVFKAQLEKQLDYLQYRFKLNLQDLNLEQMCAPEIGAAISDTELKLKSLNSNMKELNKTLFYIEYELFERPKILDNKTSSNMSNYNNYNGNYYNNNNNHHYNGNNNGNLLNEDNKKKKPLPPLNGNGQHYPMNQSVSMQSNINNQNYYK